ncbi:methionine--tRNA ligase [Pontibacter sp. E15-1]|uniref:methionine--tRNA ligase n=1 Tax=Pontibacter sp. E15-1 TaxID=2919918 RepID=UPI001F4F95AB|nr:methionine--tRNA ligase [Pontibacter sp. E15-1]MCJ8166480.1 methionine--tRNA ligase [Pontibacter sp. E15-1]
MTTTPKRYTVTAALPYANGPVHIGHLAGVYLPADIYVRYLRAQGRDVKFVCGSDEHGVPITIRAKKEGITPQQAVDKYHELIRQSFADFNVSFDIYHRTSSKVHAETAADFFRKLYEDGKFIEQTSQQYYDEKAQQFLADRYIVGTCPKCGNENAYGDQCENCGTSLNATDLINPKSTLSGLKPVMRETKHWYLPLNEYEAWLREWIVEGHKADWKPNVYGQCKSWIDQGLQPRAVTRDLDWGVPVPVEGAEGKVLYVWFDAPIGYISATKALTDDWEKYWKDEESKLVHFIGKDNIVFHCIIFPSMLKAHGDYILPDNVPANEFLNLEGDKISTSRNWAVWLHEYLQDFEGKGDVLRYVLAANAPETKDNDFTWKDFQARNNNELLAILGNFINRAVVLTQKYYNGEVPARNELQEVDRDTLEQLRKYPGIVADLIERYRFREALSELMNLARLGNKYLADTEPWKLIKTDAERVKTILNIALQISASLNILMEPFLPTTAQTLSDMLNLPVGTWAAAGAADLLPVGHTIGTPALLFEKIEDAAVEAQVQKLLDTKQANVIANAVADPAKEDITFEDFTKMDIRIGTILEAEKVAKTKKLLKLKIDTGLDQRTVVSGIAEFYNPEEIVGQQVSILVNLAPRDIKGITSQGMILMAENADGSLAFVQPSKQITNGGGVS